VKCSGHTVNYEVGQKGPPQHPKVHIKYHRHKSVHLNAEMDRATHSHYTVIFLEKENELRGPEFVDHRTETNNDKKQVVPTVTVSCKQELGTAVNSAQL
jgi:hypothetical protein